MIFQLSSQATIVNIWKGRHSVRSIGQPRQDAGNLLVVRDIITFEVLFGYCIQISFLLKTKKHKKKKENPIASGSISFFQISDEVVV